jgi:hypothetical protein
MTLAAFAMVFSIIALIINIALLIVNLMIMTYVLRYQNLKDKPA